MLFRKGVNLPGSSRLLPVRMPQRNYFILALLLLTAGCTKKEPMYTQQEMRHFVDSVMQVKSAELKEQAKRDLELRLPIELPPRIDSALHRPIGIPLVPTIDTISSNAQPLTEDSEQNIPAKK